MSSNEQNLDSLMNWMQNALFFPKTVSDQKAEQIIKPTSRLSAKQHLAIYQQSYYSRLLQCLREQFPALCFALGENLFSDFAFEYLQKYPSRRYTLYDLSQRFPDFLEETRPDKNQSQEKREVWIDFMVDLAHFEQQIIEMFDAPGNEEKLFDEILVPDENLQLQQCFAVNEYKFPVDWFYHEVRRENSPKYPPREKTFVAITRKDFLTYTIRLTEPHFIFLNALQENKSVENSLDLVARKIDMPLEKVQQSWNSDNGIRKRWIDAGFFVCKEED